MTRWSKLIFLGVASALALYFCYILARPYLGSIAAAAVLAILFYPLYRLLRRPLRNKNAAAALVTVVVVVALAIPTIILAVTLTHELTSVYQWASHSASSSGDVKEAMNIWMDRGFEWVGGHVGVSPETLRSAVISRINEASTFLLKKTGSLVGGITASITSLVITLFTLFFFLREGSRIVRKAARFMPLNDAEVDHLFERINDAIFANVYGVVAVAGSQAALAGAAFWVLGIPSPVLWTMITALCSVIPIVGSAAVWVPAAIYLIAIGSLGKGLLLLGWGAGVVSMSDNFIRPWILSGRVNMHPLLVFFALLGGVQAFGFLGLFLGPVVLSLAVALLPMLWDALDEQGSAGAPSPDPELSA